MPFIPDREKVSPVDFFNFGDTKMTTNTSAALEKAGNTNPLLQYAHSVPMSKVFQNIFLPPAKGSGRTQFPDTFTVPVLNCNDTKYVLQKGSASQRPRIPHVSAWGRTLFDGAYGFRQDESHHRDLRAA